MVCTVCVSLEINILLVVENMIVFFFGRCLEQSNWKFKNALELYVHMRRDGNIPDDAFVPDYDYND